MDSCNTMSVIVVSVEMERDEFFEALKHIVRTEQHAKMCNPSVFRCVTWCPVFIARQTLQKHYERVLTRSFGTTKNGGQG